ncbi:HAD family hydrolase [Paenibacillus aceris]|uniref:Phosphoserine phosphatase n=1 Tax=Paenibacillus aceris TaxID=869555 RepID=A0ABS4HX11_9BACL|nr:HAD family hydrolase [Paenibacillus aceris]MBP1963162.1 putative hydrolase of the HAD superfamily [Paenibacillus aceris]NHW38720.1 HAD family hydrolase [Paenibacillus aceris]
MHKKKALIFDLDNTLLWDEKSINESFQATCNQAANQFAIEAQVLENAVRTSAGLLFKSLDLYEWLHMIDVTDLEALWGQFHQGVHPNFRRIQELAPTYRRESWNLGLQMLGIDCPDIGAQLAEQFMKERRNRPFVYDDTFKVLDELHKRYELLLLTNGAPDIQQEKIDSIPGLADYFNHIVISGTFGTGKPDPAIFHHALDLLRLSPNEAVMIGDTLATDIKGAQTAGITNIWINHHLVHSPLNIRPTYEIRSLSEIPQLLHAIQGSMQQIS